MILATFDGRRMTLSDSALGNEGDHLVNAVQFDVPTIFPDGQAEYVCYQMADEIVPDPVLLGVDKTWQIGRGILATPGTVKIWLRVIAGEGDHVWNSDTAKLKVKDMPDIDGGQIVSDPDALEAALVSMSTYAADAAASASSARISASSASTQANNARSYSNNAHTYSNSAANSATSARTYSSSARGYALNAETYANRAYDHMMNAASHVVNARNSATSAATSASSAATSATSAATSASSAATSASSAATSATSAASSASQAQAYSEANRILFSIEDGELIADYEAQATIQISDGELLVTY